MKREKKGAVGIFRKFLLVERRRKCHPLDNGWSWLRPGAFCSLQSCHHWRLPLIRDGVAKGVAALPAGLSILRNSKRKVNVRMLKQIEGMKELRILSIVLSTKKNALPLIGKVKYKLLSKDNGRLFGCKIPKHVTEWRLSAKQLCHAECSWRVPHPETPLEYILREELKN